MYILKSSGSIYKKETQSANSGSLHNINAKLINMFYKSTTKEPSRQQLIAGIRKNDDNIEFFGIRVTKEVMFMQNGKTHEWKDLKGKAARLMIQAYEEDAAAKQILENLKDDAGELVNLPFSRRVELYVYYCWGSLDAQPDIKNGVLMEPENFRHTQNCISLDFGKKKLTINGQALKKREIIMIDLFGQDEKDLVVAMELGIATPTLNQHKRELYDRAGVNTKPALLLECMRQQIIR